MDDDSDEFMEKAKLACIGRSESKMERPHEVVLEKQGVDSRDEVRHSKKTDQLFIKMTKTMIG